MSSLSKRQKEIGLIVLASLFFIVLVAYTYFTVYAPAKEAHAQLTQTVESEREVLLALRKEAAGKIQNDSSSTLRAQQKVPVKPLEDAVLLQVAKAEIKSDSFVKSTAFSKNEFAILEAPENVENVFSLKTTLELEVESYSSLIKFIEELEDMERIFIIDSIEFTGPDELRETEKEMIPLTVSFSAFYRDDLENLAEEAPKVNAPPGSQKLDPFPYNDGTKEGGE